jgi:hypothetical protein
MIQGIRFVGNQVSACRLLSLLIGFSVVDALFLMAIEIFYIGTSLFHRLLLF